MRTVAGIVAATILGLILIYAVSVMAHGPVVTLTVAGEAPTATPTCTYREVRTPTPADPTQTPTPIPYADCALTTDPAGDPGGAYNLANLPLWRFDVNNSGIIDNTDKALVQAFIGVGVPTWTPTPTNTPTFTPTPTNTNTPVPTATNTPTGYTVANLLDHSSGSHDGTLCTPPANYDWGTSGRLHGAPGGSITNIKWWGTAQWTACEGQEAANTYINLQNWRAYSWDGSVWGNGNSTNSYGSSPNNWCQEIQPNTLNNAENENCDGTAAAWLMPVDDPAKTPNDRAIHWASSSQDMRDNAICHVVLYEAKKTGSGGVMVNTGLDHYVGAEGYDGDAWVGSYVALTTSYQTIGGSNCSSTILNNNSPPGVSP